MTKEKEKHRMLWNIVESYGTWKKMGEDKRNRKDKNYMEQSGNIWNVQEHHRRWEKNQASRRTEYEERVVGIKGKGWIVPLTP